jgi:HEAT repeat protein
MRIETRLGLLTAATSIALCNLAHAAPPAQPVLASQPALASAAPTVAVPHAPQPAPAAATPAPIATPAPVATPAATQPPATPALPRAAQQKAAEQKIGSDDPAAIREGLEMLGKLGGDQAANAIVARLRRGLPPKLIDTAIVALVAIGKPVAGPVMLELTLHRRPQIRAQAVAALGALKIRSAQSSLLYALDDPSPEVRIAAVSALGVVGTARALPALLVSADRGVDHVFDAYGALASPKDARPILERAKNGQLMLVLPALRAMLARANYPFASKLAILEEVKAIGTSEARACLVQWQDAFKKDARLTSALTDAVKHLDAANKLVTAAASPAQPAPAPAAAPAAAPALSPTPAPAAAPAQGAKP